MSGYTCYVVSHTHWDREWYLPFQQFRMRLVDLIDELLDLMDRDSEFKFFHFDGQTIILQDYLQIKPRNEAKLRALARMGRITIGPWYQLNDTFLTSGEATVRNMIVGLRQAEEFGAAMRIGYLPDQFGNISQIPQILNGFGMDTVIFGRGLHMENRKMEVLWESPDGTRALASVMAFWYDNARHIPAEPAECEQFLNELIAKMAAKSHTPHLLLMNGVDHQEAQQDLSDALRVGNRALKDARLVHTTLPAYVDAIKSYIAENEVKLEVVPGEMRDEMNMRMLAGTLSSRMYLKQQNEQAQTALERYVEPLSAWAWTLGATYPSEFLEYTWKLLMENHPHDSITGCSVDEVHNDMETRAAQVLQIAEELTTRGLDTLADSVGADTESLVVFNPLAWSRTDRVRADVDIRAEEYPDRPIRGVRLYDSNGEEVPFALVDALETTKRVQRPHCEREHRKVKRFVVEFIAKDVPACGYKTYRIEPSESNHKPGPSIVSRSHGQAVLDNGLLRVSMVNGSLTVEDKATGKTYSGVNTLEDRGDVGSEYRYMTPIEDTIVMSGEPDSVSVIEANPVSATLKIDYTLHLPERALDHGRGRSAATIACPITTYVKVTMGIPRVDFRTEVDNRAEDHRLRALFPTGLEVDASHAEGQFDVLTRPLTVERNGETYAPSYPQQSWVDANDGKSGICVINKGLPEYQLYGDDSHTMALTLLRCVGRRTGLPEPSSANTTPDAQCLGKRVFEYSVYPHSGTWQEAHVWRQAHQHNVPLLAAQTGAHEGVLPSEASLVEVEPAELVVTAIKKAETDNRLIVRFFNTTDYAAEGRVTVRGAKSAGLTDLNETPIETLQIGPDGSVKLKAGAKKIVTVGFGL